jgi:hypothetical protein
MKITLYCKCGGAWTGVLSPDNPEKKAKLEAIFWKAHNDPGCGPATKEEAARARRKAERDEPEG